MNSRFSLFQKILASTWILGICFLLSGILVGHNSNLRQLDGQLGLLKMPNSLQMIEQAKRTVQALFTPIEAEAQFGVGGQVVVDIGANTSLGAILGKQTAESLEKRLLRTVALAFTRFIVNLAKKAVLFVVNQLSKAGDQFKFLKSIANYAERAVSITANQIENCAEDSIDKWLDGLFPNEAPTYTRAQKCNTNIGTTAPRPTSTATTSKTTPKDVRKLTTDTTTFIRNCAANKATGNIPPENCNKTNVELAKAKTGDAVAEHLCQSSSKIIWEDVMFPAKACQAERKTKISQEFNRQEELAANAAVKESVKLNNKIGNGAPVILKQDPAKPATTTTGKTKDKEIETLYQLCFNPNDRGTCASSDQFRIAKMDQPLNSDQIIADATVQQQQTPPPAGEADLAATILNTLIEEFVNTLTQLLTQSLNFITNKIFAAIDGATGNLGLFSNLASDVGGAVKNYIGDKTRGFVSDIKTSLNDVQKNIDQANSPDSVQIDPAICQKAKEADVPVEGCVA